MVETYIFYSSLALSGMGCIALALSILFRLKSRKINSLSTNLLANNFSKTFKILDPYGEKTRVIHRLLSLLPLLLTVFLLVFLIALLEIIQYGLFLSFLIVIAGLNLLLIDVFSEVYQDANIFIKAIDAKADVGVGDVKAFQILKNAIPKLSNYHLILSISFFILAFTIGYIWSSLLWLFGYLVNLILEIGAPTGFIAYAVVTIIFVSIVAIIQILVNRVKNKFLTSIIETPSLGE
jgi:predicted membrane metal-binding protein